MKAFVWSSELSTDSFPGFIPALTYISVMNTSFLVSLNLKYLIFVIDKIVFLYMKNVV
jgi:hypothetical protein